MKSLVAAALIVSGTILMLAPYVSNAVGTREVGAIMMQLGKDANGSAHMPVWYDVGCFFAGIGMILVATASSLRQRAV